MNPVELDALLARAFPGSVPERLDGERGPRSLRDAAAGACTGIAFGNELACLEIAGCRTPAAPALEIVARQSAWPGGAKCVARGPLSLLRAEVPLFTHTAAGRDWVVAQLRLAHAGVLAAAGGDAAPARAPGGGAVPPDPELLAFACAAAGWQATPNPDASVRIDLPVRGVQRTVTLRQDGTAVRASLDLAPGALRRASGPCREAAGRFLLRASAALRWARAFASRENGELDAAGFECFVAAPCYEQALLLAADTLIAACERFGLEAELLLEQADVAQRYLQRGTASGARAEGHPGSTGAVAPRAPAPSHAAHAALA
ncbi:MAG: hypothetical protein IT514_01555 [Burkholderiales bacterium]|nr:hypothetical protein [Burkholderiales bacterium]